MSASAKYTSSYQQNQNPQVVWNQTIEISPGRLRHFGSAEGARFCLVTNESLEQVFKPVGDSDYESMEVLVLPKGQQLESLIEERVPDSAHVLVISPEAFLVSPHPERLGHRKLIVMPCASTPTNAEAIRHFLQVMQRSDPAAEVDFVERFFDLGRASEKLEFINDQYSTSAVFEHLADDYEWNVQAGPLGWGEQQIAPSGELSVCPGSIMAFEPDRTLNINGEIALEGPLAIHCGSPSFYEPDRVRLHTSLSAMKSHAVILSVNNGCVTDLRPTHRDSEAAARTLSAMIELDSRYGVIWECGFGINTALSLVDGNVGMNEPYGGSNGCSHWGLGLTPYTQYALIILAPGTRILGKGGAHLIGEPGKTQQASSSARGGMRSVKNGACGCYPS